MRIDMQLSVPRISKQTKLPKEFTGAAASVPAGEQTLLQAARDVIGIPSLRQISLDGSFATPTFWF